MLNMAYLQTKACGGVLTPNHIISDRLVWKTGIANEYNYLFTKTNNFRIFVFV